MSKAIDLTGATFGRLTVLSRADSVNGRATWNCRCSCGKLCRVKGKYLRNGDTKSCGCLAIDTIKSIGKANSVRNRYEIEGDIVRVYFNHSDKFFICDKADEELVAQHTWFLNNTGYARTQTSSGETLLFHNLVVPNTEDVFCDHINGNRLDNRRKNLRAVSREQNAMNRGIRTDSSSGSPGVSWHKQSQKWQAYICKNNCNYYLGIYDRFEDAVTARECAEIEYFGEYRRHN